VPNINTLDTVNYTFNPWGDTTTEGYPTRCTKTSASGAICSRLGYQEQGIITNVPLIGDVLITNYTAVTSYRFPYLLPNNAMLILGEFTGDNGVVAPGLGYAGPNLVIVPSTRNVVFFPPNSLPSDTNHCLHMVFRPSSNEMLIGCVAYVVRITLNTQDNSYFPLASSMVRIPVGVGVFRQLAYSSTTDMLFIASQAGLGFAVDGTTTSIRSIVFIPSLGTSDPLNYVFVDEDLNTTAIGYPRKPVVWWGTDGGWLARTNFGLNTMPILDLVQVPQPSSFSSPIGITQIISYNEYSRSTLLIMTAYNFAAFDNTFGNVTSVSMYSTPKVNCIAYTCDQCILDPYCGWCYSKRACTSTLDTSCPAGDLGISSNSCPVLSTLSVSSGANTGGTTVVVYSNFFRTDVPIGSYSCNWKRTTAPLVDMTTPALQVTSGSLTCITPNIGQDTVTTNVALRVMYQTVLWLDKAATFRLYRCQVASCSSCTSIYRPECGWCFTTHNCSSINNGACPTTSLVDANLAWLGANCPRTTTIVPSVASLHYPQNFTVGVANFPVQTGTSYQCEFGVGGSVSPASGVLEPTLQTTFIAFSCPLPYNLTITTHTTFPVGILRVGEPEATSIRTAKELVYDCPLETRCDACSNPLFTECNWCPTTRTCEYLSNVTCTGSGICPAVDLVSPPGTQAWNASRLPLTLYGHGFSNYPSLKCLFSLLNGTHTIIVSSPVSSYNDTVAHCSTPNTTSTNFGIGNWSLSLAYNSVPTTDPVPFFVYDCSLFTDCLSCASSYNPDCSWCGRPSLTGCYNQTTIGSNCSLSIIDSSNNHTCPSIGAISPQFVFIGVNSTAFLIGSNFNLQAGDVASLRCGFLSSSSDTLYTSPVLFNTSNLVTCEPLLIAETGNASTFLYDTVTGMNFTTSINISVVDCSSLLTCQQCLQSDCSYCAGNCTQQCTIPGAQQLVCPSLTSVSPTYADLSGLADISIYGSKFLDLSTLGIKRSLNARRSGSVRATNDSQAGLRFLDTHLTRDALYALTSTSTSSVPQLSYSCAWGSQEMPATWLSSSLVTCPTPSGGVPRNVSLSLMLNSNTYLAIPDPITFFTCPTVVSDGCSELCTSSPHCGWCTVTSSCTSVFECPSQLVWQPTCTTAQLNENDSPIPGGGSLSVTLSVTLPSFTFEPNLTCRFGSKSSPAIFAGRSPVDHSISSASCEIPPFPSPSGATVPFSLFYSNERLTLAQPFVYIDCNQYSGSCTQCTAKPGCGWCGGKCSLRSQCSTPAQWTKQQCPPNALAIGLGVSLSLAFLLALLLLSVFLIRRARQHQGIYIKMREPDYDAIAWGSDRELQYRVAAGKWSVLDRHLGRPDHLLQLALSLNCPPTEQDSLAKALVYVAATKGDAVLMIQAIIRAEVRTCREENTLFRSNSVASKMYKFYSRIVGIKYLYRCIARLVLELEVLGEKAKMSAGGKAGGRDDEERGESSAVLINKRKNEVSILDVTMELDAENDDGTLNDDVDTDTNNLQLQLICQKILNVLIKKTLHNIPSPLRQIFVEIDRSVTSKFPGSLEAVYKGLGGLFFLRFVCPALTAPHVYGLLPQPPNEITQRQLVLITKVIQSIANMQPPGKKEKYMEIMGSFIESSIPRIIQFYNNLREAANINIQDESYETQPIVPENVLLNGLASAQRVLVPNATKLKSWAETSFLDPDEQNDLVRIIDECIADEPSEPKKHRPSSTSKKASKS